MDYQIASEYFKYNPDTGLLYWKKRPGKKVHIGDVVGHVSVKGYIKLCFKWKYYYAHSVAWLLTHGFFPDQLDHINHIGTDNRLCNLRLASSLDNARNRSMNKRNKTGITGVQFRGEKFIAIIRANGSYKYLGSYAHIFEAACARKSAENKFGYHVNHGLINP